MIKFLRNLFVGQKKGPEQSPEELRLQRLLDDANDQIDYLIQQNQELNKEYKSLESDLSRAMEQVVVMESYRQDNEHLRDLLEDAHRALANKPSEVFVMSPEGYARMEKNLEQGIVTKDTNPQQTGYLLGIQRALTYLRQNHVAIR